MGSVQTFKLNQVNSGDTFDFTTASSDASGLLYDREFNNQLASVASSDGTNEKFKVTFDTPQDISAVGLMNHNIKTGNIKYLDSGSIENGFVTGADMAINGGFDSDVAGWSVTRGTIASIAGGVSGNCLELTRTVANTSFFAQTTGYSFIGGKSYEVSGHMKSGTAGDGAYKVAFYTGSGSSIGGSLGDIITGTSSGSWVKWSAVVTAPSTGSFVFLIYKNNTIAGTMLFDEIVVKEAIADFTDNTDTNSFFDKFTEVTDAYGIVVNCDYTIGAVEKKIGQLLSLESLYDFDSAKRLAPRLKIQQEFNTKSDGGLDKIINGVKHSGSVKFDNLDSTDIGNLFALAIHPDPFWIYLAGLSDTNLKQFFKVDDIYLVNMTNEPYPQMPSGLIDTIGWVDKIDYSEV